MASNKPKKVDMIRLTLPAMPLDMGGVEVLQPFPTNQVERLDPFLLLHHHYGVIEAGSHPRHLGVGPHPHRGFSPVTFIFNGDVHHRDSRGNSSIVHKGGVQWMDAGMGIIHSERPSMALAEKGGEQEIVQLWINTPAASKMNQPSYQAIQQEEMPKVAGLAGDVRVVAGAFADTTGPIKSNIGITALMGELVAQDTITLTTMPGEQAMLYVLAGNGFLNGYGLVEEKTLYVFKDHASQTALSAKSDLKFLFVKGQPLHEKVAQYGPYVMNSQTEILEALRDYQMGKMGFLVEDF